MFDVCANLRWCHLRVNANISTEDWRLNLTLAVRRGSWTWDACIIPNNLERGKQSQVCNTARIPTETHDHSLLWNSYLI